MEHKINVQSDDLEWLFVPDIVYKEYDDCKRHMHLFVPYRQKWEDDTVFPVITHD